MATSFISERSAEYILIPKLCGILAPHFRKIIPLYFWSTREGSGISRACSAFQKVRVINVFARRPKVWAPHQPSIEVKLNKVLFEVAQESLSLGIPTFAGVPLASSIFDLSFDLDCIWFDLMELNNEIIYQISLEGDILSKLEGDTLSKSESNNKTDGVIKEANLIESIFSKCDLVEWRDAVESLRTIRRGGQYGTFYSIFGSGYRPFHLILLD